MSCAKVVAINGREITLTGYVVGATRYYDRWAGYLYELEVLFGGGRGSAHVRVDRDTFERAYREAFPWATRRPLHTASDGWGENGDCGACAPRGGPIAPSDGPSPTPGRGEAHGRDGECHLTIPPNWWTAWQRDGQITVTPAPGFSP